MSASTDTDSVEPPVDQSPSPSRPARARMDDRARFDMDKGIDLALGVVVLVLIASATLPLAFDTWFNTSTSSWNPMVAQLWPLIPLFGLLGIAIYVIQSVR